ncbi:hypothetical protein BJ912DRAFT_225379 [Pholiota molesta]|nr:hypothetical protein BJ912DRAFT_225379 [Pholiota molesta]
MSNSTEILAIVGSLSGAEIARTLTISMFALTVYDYALTMEKEVTYFWKRSFSISHALFFFNRYVPVCIIVYVLSY